MMSTSDHTIIKEATALSIYPNPAKDQLYLASTLGEKIEAIRIRNISGQLVESPIVNTALVIPINNLVAGIYLLEVQTKTGRYYKKILKN